MSVCAVVYTCMCEEGAFFIPGPVCLCVSVCMCVCAQSAASVSVFDRGRWMSSLWSLSPSALLSVGLHSTTNHQVLTQSLTCRPEEDKA